MIPGPRRAPCLLLLLPVLAGCGSEDRERPPWERDGSAPRVARDAAPDGATDGGAPAFAAVEGRVDLEGSRASVELGGLRVTPGGLVRGWLEADLDGDGDTDAALLQELPPEEGQTERAVELLAYRRDDAELVAAGGQPVPPGLGPGCQLSSLSLRLAAPGAVALVTGTRCPGSPDDAAATPRTSSLAALAKGPFPLRLAVTARLEGDAATLSMGVADRDGDGTPDAVLGLERAGARAEVVWLERTAGPAVDPAATEKSLQAALPPPGGRKRLQASLPRVQGVVDLRRLLCTGTLDGASLMLAERPAHECRPSRATGAAIAMLVRGHVDVGRIPEARAALSLLTMEGVGLGEDRRAALEQSIADHMKLTVESTHETGPAAALAPVAPGGRAAVRFLDDDRIWVETSPPFIYYLSSRTAQPTEPLPTPANPATPAPRPSPPPAMPEARSGAHRAVGTAAGLWIGDGADWALLDAARVGGSWADAVSLAISPSGDAVAAVRGGHLEVVRVQRPVQPVPADGSGSGPMENRDGGSGGAPRAATSTGERDPSAP